MMEFLIRPRLGIGFDMEHNEDICYRASFGDDDEETILCYIGLIIKIPFFTIMIGSFYDRKDIVDA